MTLTNKNILVTGGAGFIGSHLVDELVKEKPNNITIVDNFFLGKEENLVVAKKNFPNLKIYHENVANYQKMEEIVKREKIDVIFNLAVIPLPASLEKPAWTTKENIEITITCCELLRKKQCETLIHFSSSEVYGTCLYEPMDEKHPIEGRTPYAASKAASDEIIMSYIYTFGVDAAIIRPFNNYGPRQNEKSYAGVIPLTINRILTGKNPIIYGDGKQTRDYIYVTDTAQATINIYKSKKTRGKVLNIASGQEISIIDLITIIGNIMKNKKKIFYKKSRPGDVKRHIANMYLAKDLINFKPCITFEEGIKRTIVWYKKNF